MQAGRTFKAMSQFVQLNIKHAETLHRLIGTLKDNTRYKIYPCELDYGNHTKPPTRILNILLAVLSTTSKVSK